MQQEPNSNGHDGKADQADNLNIPSSQKLVFQNADVTVLSGNTVQLVEIPGATVLFAGKSCVKVIEA